MLRTYFYLNVSVPIEREVYQYLESYGENRAAAVRHCFVASWLANGRFKPKEYMRNESIHVFTPDDEHHKKIFLRWNCDFDDDPIVIIANNASTLKRAYRAPYLTKMLIAGFELLSGKSSFAHARAVINKKNSDTVLVSAAIKPEKEAVYNTKPTVKVTPSKKDFTKLMGKRK
jgi:hypothetical protein